MKNRNSIVKIVLFVLFLVFLGLSFWVEFQPGMEIGHHFELFSFQMLKILPVIFILIGLFDVWVKRETIEKHLGTSGGAYSFFWAFLLAAPMAGGLLPALPIAHALYQKGARLTFILTFLGAVSVGRAPMILFESTFLGWKFSAIRLLASIPLVVLSGILIGRILLKSGYKLPTRR